MNLRDYLRALRTNWWMIVVTSIVGVAAAVGYVASATPIYEGSVQFFATTPSVESNSPLQGDQFGQQRVNSYVKLLSSQRLAERIEETSEVELGDRDLMRAVRGEADLNTVLFTAYVRDSSPAVVSAIVGGVAEEFPKLVAEIESQGGEMKPPVKLDVVSGPTTKADPVSPVKRLWIGLGLVLGVLLGVALALLRALLDRSVRTGEVLREVSRVPVLGRIPRDRSSKKGPVLLDRAKGWSTAEAFRQLRTNLHFVDIERPVSVLVVTSSVAAEGKSTTAANLAISFAQAGKRVLVIDADLRRPTLDRLLGLERAVGLTNVLAGQVTLQEVVQPWRAQGLHFLASGPIPPNPSELLASQRMEDLLREARKTYDLVFIDTAPLLPVTDGAIAAAHADGALVVVRYGRTRRAEVERAVDSLRAVDARVVGAALTQIPHKGADAYSYEGYTSLEGGPRRSRLTRWRRRRRRTPHSHTAAQEHTARTS